MSGDDSARLAGWLEEMMARGTAKAVAPIAADSPAGEGGSDGLHANAKADDADQGIAAGDGRVAGPFAPARGRDRAAPPRPRRRRAADRQGPRLSTSGGRDYAAAGRLRERTNRERSNARRLLCATICKQSPRPSTPVKTDQARKRCQSRYQRSPYAAITFSRFRIQFWYQRWMVIP